MRPHGHPPHLYLVNTAQYKLKQMLQGVKAIIEDLFRVIVILTASLSNSLIWLVLQPGKNEWDFIMGYLSLNAMVPLIKIPKTNIMEIIDSIQLAIRDANL